jgi:hypothetical protein
MRPFLIPARGFGPTPDHATAPMSLSSFDGRFDYGRNVHWKADRPKRILGTCPNRVIDPVNAARFMTAASTLQRLARSAALNALCAARPSRIGTPLGCLDIGSSPVQLRIRMTTDVRAATNFRGAEKSRVWLGGRYSMARRRNGSSQGFHYRA